MFSVRSARCKSIFMYIYDSIDIDTIDNLARERTRATNHLVFAIFSIFPCVIRVSCVAGTNSIVGFNLKNEKEK